MQRSPPESFSSCDAKLLLRTNFFVRKMSGNLAPATTAVKKLADV
jgi:hypothetical protein